MQKTDSKQKKLEESFDHVRKLCAKLEPHWHDTVEKLGKKYFDLIEQTQKFSELKHR